jgi:hypothetical protein
LPLLPKPPRTHATAAAKQYEAKFVELEGAMRDIDADRVQRIVAELNALSMHIEDEESVGAYLEKGRFSWAARQNLRKEYIDRYVLLRGGGGGMSSEPKPQDAPPGPPLYTQPVGAGYSKMAAGDVWTRGDAPPGSFAGPEVLSEISDPQVRTGFIQKVYGLLSLQLIATVLIAALMMNLVGDYLRENSAIGIVVLIASTIALFVSVCSFACSPDLARSFPTNYILLGVMTLAMAVLIGFTSSAYTSGSVLVVTIMTAIVVVGLTVLAVTAIVDFTGAGPYLACALMVIIGMSLVTVGGSMLGYGDSEALKTVRLVISAATAILFSFYIVYDTQLIVGGKHENQYSVDDYVLAVISLYLDIVNLFTSLLDLFGDRRDF